MRLGSIITSFAIAFLLGCLQGATKPPRPINELADPTTDADLDKVCSAACANLRAIECPEGFGSLGGISCTQICISRSMRGPTPVQCWADAKTTAEAKACGSLRCVK